MPAAIRLEQVRRRFGRVVALDGLSLEVPEGQTYGFLGRNGAGKTTTLRILMGILHADAGTLELFGERVRRVTVKHKRLIGYVSQEPTFYPWMTADELGRFVGGLYPTWEATELTRLLKLLDVPTDRRAAELSGGTRAKLGLALALAARPRLLLLDEPTAGLDPVVRAEFNDLLKTLQCERGITVFCSSHLVSDVEQLAHRVGIIHAGRTRYEGEVAALLASVRRVNVAPGGVAPAGFELLRDGVYRADAAAWASGAWPPETQFETLSLEEVFLAFARTDKAAA
jgi:ABC-2 type transport system ATP-binding protein